MADAEEDVIPTRVGLAEDFDLSDETQDFRFLTPISREDATIPKRGEKDFEPHATALQSNTLAASRQAMHNALSYQRFHQPKGYTTGTYHPETNMAYTVSPNGKLFTTMGRVLPAHHDPLGNDAQRGQRLWLLPEEVLYLLERGNIDVRWPAVQGETLGLPMSLQGAYAMFIGDEESHGGALTLERFSVYSGLKRLGYTVMRAPTWSSGGPPIGKECYPPLPQRTWQTGFLHVANIWRLIFPAHRRSDHEQEATGPIIPPGIYRDYSSIYRRLALVNFYDPTCKSAPSEPEVPPTDPNFRITYHVWKPGSPNFKKLKPGGPDFRIAVIDARATSVPTLQQLSALMETVPYDPPKPDSNLNAKIKQGYKNVILAVVDNGVTSYLNIKDAAFGRQKVYERLSAGRGGKRGGGRGGRGGRGRGRGR